MSNKGKLIPLKFKNLQELKHEFERLNLVGQDPRNLLLKLDTIYNKAEDKIKCHDQEEAYILLMKYLSVVCFIQKSEDYKKDEKYFNAMLGKKPKHAMAIAEGLHSELKDRYSDCDLKTQEAENNVKNLGMKSGGTDNLLIQPPDMRTKEEEKSTFVTSVKLFNMLRDGVTQVFIMDTRPSEDFQSSNIGDSCVINIPDDKLKLGMSANMLEQLLNEDTKVSWKQRGTYDQIVLLDWNTGQQNINDPSKVNVLKEILSKWDIHTQYKNENILILDGGYNDWLNSYPWYATNPKPQRPVADEPVLNEYLDQVNYPDLDDLNETVNQEFLKPFFDRSQKPYHSVGNVSFVDEEMREVYEPAPARKPAPEFDRAEKKAAIKTYEQRKADMENLLKQKVIETSEAVELEKDMIDSERELQENIKSQDIEGDDEKLKQLEEQELKLMQKVEKLRNESAEKDDKIMELQKIIEIYEERDLKELSKKEEDKERQLKEAEINEKIRKQEEEKQRLAKERLDIEKENGMIEASRKKRKHDNTVLNELKNNRLIPQINRSMKPNNAYQTYQAPIKIRQWNGTKGNVGRGLTGLKNLGNTCYMNSILQCISNNSALAKYFCGDHYREDVNRSNKTRGEVAEEVAAVVKMLWSGHFRAIACKDLKYTVGMVKPEYGSYEQQDSHEFLTFLMDWLHNDLNKVPMNNKLDISKSMSDADKAWSDFKRKNESLISTLFYGLQKSTVRCLVCGEESVTYEPFSNLSLIIPDGEGHSLKKCLSLYLKGERITGWRCPKCQELRDAEKKTDICKLPPILVIHLKRFHYIEVFSKKRTTYVDFPLTDLNMSQFIVDSKQRGISYDLYGVSNHYGTMQGGHYTAYCKSALFKKWYKFDDHEVVEMSPSEVKTNAAYILFYTSISYQVPESTT